MMIVYNGLLLMSLVVFLSDPGPNFGLSGTLVLFGPTFGSPVLAAVTVVQMLRKKITVANGLGAIALLTTVSFVCIALAFSIFMGV